ncbi:S1 family peptidase [Pseudomonas juntendi]
MPNDSWVGRFTSDPLIDSREGDIIRFQARYFQVVGPLISQEIRQLSEFDGVVVGLLFKYEDRVEMTGSGVIIAPGFALCAMHVLDGCIDDIVSGDIAVYAVGMRDDFLELWKVEKFKKIDSNDVAILSISLSSPPHPSNSFNLAHITTRVPFVGERICVVGFVAAKSEFEIKHDVPWEIQTSLLVSKGEVTEVFRNGRDRVMIPGPCFGLKCQTWGGMSGGPAFDLNGNLIGLLTSSYDNDDMSFISLIWPALCFDVEQLWPVMDVSLNCPLLENPQCPILGRELVSFTNEGGILTASNSS